MKIIIEIEDNNLSSIQFKSGKKILDWSNMSMQEQIKIINTLMGHYQLFSKCIKSD